jgi:hypothetical protein
MKTIKSYKKFGKLCYLAFDLAAVEEERKRWNGSEEDRKLLNESRRFAIERSGLDTKDYGQRHLVGSVDYSVREGLNVLVIEDAPFWDMNDDELAAFLRLLDELQITGFIYESRDSAAYQSFYRLNDYGWKMAGLTRRVPEWAQYKVREGIELKFSDYIYGIRFRKTRKNLKKF